MPYVGLNLYFLWIDFGFINFTRVIYIEILYSGIICFNVGCKFFFLLTVSIGVGFNDFIHVIYTYIICRNIICFNFGCKFFFMPTVSADWLIWLCRQIRGTHGNYFIIIIGRVNYRLLIM